METTLKKYLAVIMAAFAMCLVLAVPQAWADESITDVSLAKVQDADEVSVTLKSNAQNVVGLQLDLNIEVTGEHAASITPTFVFSDSSDMLKDAKIRDYRWDGNNGRMSIFVSGVPETGTGLFGDDPIVLGSIKPVASGIDGAVSAQLTIKVPESDFLTFVKSGASRMYEEDTSAQFNVEPTDRAITLVLSATPEPAPTPDPLQNVQRNNTNLGGTGLAETGDTLMPIIIGLACVAVAAVVVIAVVIVRRKKSGNNGTKA